MSFEQLVDTVNLYMCRLSSRIICACVTDEDVAQARAEVVQGPACTTQNLDAPDDEPERDSDFESKVEGLRRLYTFSPEYSPFYDVYTDNGIYKVRPGVIELDSDDNESQSGYESG